MRFIKTFEIHASEILQEGLKNITYLDKYHLIAILKKLGFRPYSKNEHKKIKRDIHPNEVIYFYDNLLISWGVLFKNKKAFDRFNTFTIEKLSQFKVSTEILPQQNEFDFLIDISVQQMAN